MSAVRQTRQRRAIQKVINQASRPLSAPEIHERGQLHCPGLGLRTVYRHIRELLRQEKLVSLDYPGQPPRFEPVHQKHHPHFICRICQRLFDLPNGVPPIGYTPPSGFRIVGEEVVFFGICPDCAPEEAP